MEKRDIERYLIIALLIVLVYLSYLLVKPFITALIASAILAYLSYPVYKRLSKKINKIAAATIITLLLTVIIVFPFISITKTIVTESQNIRESQTLQQSLDFIKKYIEESQYSSIIEDMITKFTSFIQNKASNFIISLPSKLFHFVIALYATFAFLLLGEEIVTKIKKMIPAKNKEEIIKNIGDTTYSIIYGLFITAMAEFVLAYIALKIIGSGSALILALVIGFLAFIPFLGPIVIWAPYAVIEITRNNFGNAAILIILGVILFLIETVLKTKITAHHAKLHPVIILIGTIGGITVMGFIGLVAGPVILSILVTIVESYYLEIKNEA